jgi:hypothetical protein
VAERPPKPGPAPARRPPVPSRAPAGEPTNAPAPPEGAAPSLTGGPDREYRSGEIEPSQTIQSPPSHDGDWEEKTVVDDSQLYNTKDGPSTLSIGTTTGEDELTIDEPSRSVATGLARPMAPGRPTPAPARPAPAPARPTNAPAPGAQVPEAALGKLMVIAGNDAGREYPLHGKTITVGRGIDNDVVLTDIAVSRKHMSIGFDGSRYHLSDKGSGNGTIINQRVETGTRVLSHGDRIEIGNTVFRLEHPASEKASWAAGAPAKPPPPPPKLPGAGAPASASASPALPLPAIPQPPATLHGNALPPPPHHGAESGPPTTITGSSPVGDIAAERALAESALLPEAPGPWTPPTLVPPPMSEPALVPPPMSLQAPAPALMPAAFSAPAASPAYVPMVPRGPLSPRKLLVGTAATFAALIAIAIAGMLIGGDESLAGQSMEPPVRVEEMLLPLLVPLLELGAAPASASPAIEPGDLPDAVPDEIPAAPEPAGDGAPAP